MFIFLSPWHADRAYAGVDEHARSTQVRRVGKFNQLAFFIWKGTYVHAQENKLAFASKYEGAELNEGACVTAVMITQSTIR